MKQIIATICFFLCIAGSIGILWKGSQQLMAAQASQSWPIVSGTITSAEIQTNMGTSNQRMHLRVSYAYTIGGIDYANDRITFSFKPATRNGSKSPREHQMISVARKNVGDSISVYYDPLDPENSVLVPGGWIFALLYVGAALFLLAVSRVPFWFMTGRFPQKFQKQST